MIRGVIEGFYGPPWSWDDRVAVARWCADRGMPHYVWAPKDDPLHRRRWREPWTGAHLAGFRRLAGEDGVVLGVALSPGLDIDYGSSADRAALWAKVAPAVEAGAGLLVLALDDIADRPGLGRDHAELTAGLAERLAGTDAALALVPTQYVGGRPTDYLRALAEGVPPEVPIGWTGTAVVNDRITVAEASERSQVLGGRPPLLWDNVPVNDAVMDDRLFLGPLRGRDAGLPEVLGGYLANAMVQPRASMLPLASIAAFLRKEDPVAAWAVAANDLGWRLLAEACDGTVPRGLVAELAEGMDDTAAAALRRWLEACATVHAPGLEEEAGPWLAQARAEAAVGLDALRLVGACRPELGVGPDRPTDLDVLLSAFALMRSWPAVHRGAVSVLGVRCGFRPALGQGPDGAWSLFPGLLQEDENALDHLVRLALRLATG